jgi:predicted nuclease of restriction endonuclease-like (RecB) superfamily
MGHIIELLKIKDATVRDWYAERAVEQNWKLEVLEHQIATGLHRRIGAAPNNLEARLPSDGAELARNVAKDPLVLDFLGLTTEAEELAIEKP